MSMRCPDIELELAGFAAARRDAAWTLVLAARILERSERNALSDVFGQRLPRAVAESLGGPAPTPEGGQG
ncbi:MAG: hypothetical protein IH621_10760 [Krumholzibacteria bacterium]|nr:hypothetical protein [Candidatus Krumholzibacteria bacterium]